MVMEHEIYEMKQKLGKEIVKMMKTMINSVKNRGLYKKLMVENNMEILCEA